MTSPRVALLLANELLHVWLLTRMTASALLVVGVLVLSAYALRSHGSASSPRRPAGPVLTASVRSLKLSKTLRLIPVTRLPPIKLRVRVPFTRVSLCVAVHPSSSETVVHQLSLPHLDVLSRDVGRDGVRVDAHKLAAHVDSNYSLKFVFTVHGLDEFRQLDHKLFALSTSGRCSIKVSDATLAAKVSQVFFRQLYSGLMYISTHTKLWLCPKPELAAASLRMGQLEHFALRYTRLAAPLNLFMRHLGGTIWADYPAELALTFVVREILKSDELDSDLSRLSRHLSAHVDSAQWEDKEDGDRLAAVPVLTPPTGSGRLWGLTVPSPVVLRDFKLPDLVPELYRAGGTREKLQALNFLTGKVELKLSSNAVERCSWRDAVASTQKGETRIVLEDFECAFLRHICTVAQLTEASLCSAPDLEV